MAKEPEQKPIGMGLAVAHAFAFPHRLFVKSNIERLPQPAVFYAIVASVSAVAGVVWQGATLGAFDSGALLFAGPGQFVLAFPAVYVLTTLHHWVARVILPGRVPFSLSLSVVAYASTPALIAWLPGMRLPTVVWSLGLVGVGFARLRGISIVRGLTAPFSAILIPVGIALTFRTLVVEAFRIPSAGMFPTLATQDHIFARKLQYALGDPVPSYGEIIVFDFPDAPPGVPPQDFVQRVVALPGDTVQVRDNALLVNGWHVPTCQITSHSADDDQHLAMEFLGESAYIVAFDTSNDPENWGPFTVPDGEVFVVGDNRLNSHDSRRWSGGRGRGVPLSAIHGRASSIWFPLGRMADLIHSAPQLPEHLGQLTHGVAECMHGRPDMTIPPSD